MSPPQDPITPPTSPVCVLTTTPASHPFVLIMPPVSPVMENLSSFTGLIRRAIRVAIRVGVCVGAGNVEVDVSYITFMMRAQHRGLLGTVQDSVPLTHTTDHTWF